MRRLLLLMVLSVFPIRLTPSGTQESAGLIQEARCGDGSCCPYEDAVCGLNGKNYENKELRTGTLFAHHHY